MAPPTVIPLEQAIDAYLQEAKSLDARAREYNMGAQIIQKLLAEIKALRDLLAQNNIELPVSAPPTATPPVPAPAMDNILPLPPQE